MEFRENVSALVSRVSALVELLILWVGAVVHSVVSSEQGFEFVGKFCFDTAKNDETIAGVVGLSLAPPHSPKQRFFWIVTVVLAVDGSVGKKSVGC